VSSSRNDFDVLYRRSLERSRARRAAAGQARRRRLRLRGGGASLALVALAVAVLGAGAAVGQQVATSGSSSAALLAEGAQGPQVGAVQSALGIGASGVFDDRTEAAVRSFQQRRGLLVDGIVGPQTRAALGLSPAAASGGGPAAATSSSQAAAGGNASLEAIAQCESGGNPRAVGGGGQFRGKRGHA